ncbi:unnamed protein product [Strongylus vulgaris]|uniref:7TM GPCR serpentine receptor class x (Srx) domain-containing protein n=1 Tax=Strongylus vulgaris TaxID=40348 RepID=A0A3P7J2C9_STRVU|nr:unnamed protein product [Strongylus vulgaris]
MTAAMEVVSTGSTVLFGFAVALNSFFIYVVATKGRKNIGTYKYLMISFAVCNIFYSTAEFASKPGMYGMETALLALHFLYRYVIVCRPTQQKYFDKFYFVLWSLPVLSWGFVYGCITFYCFAPTEQFYKFVEESVRDKLNREVRELSLFSIYTHVIRMDTTVINYPNAIGLLLMVIMMVLTFGVMLVCGLKTARMLRKTSMSAKMLDIQTQLLRALTVQVRAYGSF